MSLREKLQDAEKRRDSWAASYRQENRNANHWHARWHHANEELQRLRGTVAALLTALASATKVIPDAPPRPGSRP